MKILPSLCVLTLTALPTLGMARCQGEALDQTAAGCMPGMIRDAEAGSCIEAPTSQSAFPAIRFN